MQLWGSAVHVIRDIGEYVDCAMLNKARYRTEAFVTTLLERILLSSKIHVSMMRNLS